jgi:serine/threonine protein kinase
LGDFGLSRIMGDESIFAYTNVGTPYYMSPEQIAEQKYNHKSDIWSTGCVLYEIVSLKAPFEAKSKVELAGKIKKGTILPIPSVYSPELFDVIEKMICVDVQKRLSCEQLMEHPKICFVLRALRLKEMEANVKRKEEELKKKSIGQK